MRRLILGGAAGLVLAAGCAPTQEVTQNTSGRTAQADPNQAFVARVVGDTEKVMPDISGRTASAAPNKEFVARVVGDTEDVWDALFLTMGNPPYPRPKVVMFSGTVVTACGLKSAAVGPYYCQADRKVYLDTGFLSKVFHRDDPPGAFSQAYLIVYEISHHVQNALGTTQQFEHTQSGLEERQRNESRVRFALQADCYTGVWAHFVQKRNLLSPADIEEGVPAAQAVGDAITHGTAAQRIWWFKHGLTTGAPQQCDTLAVSQP